MNTLGISASPRRGGNSETLLDEFLKGARQSGARANKIILNELAFVPCQACGGCDKTGVCVIDDGMSGVYKELGLADIVAVASPVHFGNVSAQLKMMIDRFQCEWVRRFVLLKGSDRIKKGVFLCVYAGHDERLIDCARKAVKILFNTIGVEYTAEIVCADVDDKGAIAGRKDVLKQAFDLGKSIAKGDR